MKFYEYRNQLYTMRELADLTGVNYTTMVERLKRGYTVEEAVADEPRVPDSINAFVEASYPPDWDGMVNADLYKAYAKWCDRNDYRAESNVQFARCVKKVIPTLRTVPSRIKNFGEISYKRVVRVDNYM